MKLKTKLRINQLLGGGLMFTPLAIGIGANFGDYVTSSSSAFALTAGGGMAAFMVLLQMFGKAKKVLGSAVMISGIVFALCVLLEPLILNLKFLTGLMFVGQLQYKLFFDGRIKNYLEEINLEKAAQATAGATAASLEKVIESIRGAEQ